MRVCTLSVSRHLPAVLFLFLLFVRYPPSLSGGFFSLLASSVLPDIIRFPLSISPALYAGCYTLLSTPRRYLGELFRPLKSDSIRYFYRKIHFYLHISKILRTFAPNF